MYGTIYNSKHAQSSGDTRDDTILNIPMRINTLIYNLI